MSSTMPSAAYHVHKGIVQPTVEIMSSFTHPILLQNTKEDIFKNFLSIQWTKKLNFGSHRLQLGSFSKNLLLCSTEERKSDLELHKRRLIDDI